MHDFEQALLSSPPSTSVHLYPPQDVVLTSMLHATVAGYIRILLPASMQDPANELRRIPIPRTWVNSVGCLAVEQVVLLTILIFAAAILYSSVGHAGASGYLAAMALVGLAPDVMKPTELVLNILVATIATVRFYRAGYFYGSAFWPFVVGSIPLAFIGGALPFRATSTSQRWVWCC